MITGLITLLLFDLLGEMIVILFQWPIPGPVVGMMLLFVYLLIRGHVSEDLDMAAKGLLKYLALLFVPAGSGIIVYVALIREEWLPIVVALVGGTFITLAITALTMQALIGARGRSGGAALEKDITL